MRLLFCLVIGLTTSALAERPEVALCIDTEPLSRAAAELVAVRVRAAKVIPRRRCPTFGFRAQVMNAGVVAKLVLHTPDGQRLSRPLPWLRSAEAALMHTAMADQLGVFAARLAGLITEAQLSAAPESLAVAPADSVLPVPEPAPVKAPRSKKPARQAARRVAPSPAGRTRPAKPERPAPSQPADTRPPPPVVALRPPPPEPSVFEPMRVIVVPNQVVPPRPLPPDRPPLMADWQFAADLGMRLRGAAGLAPDTAFRLGWRSLLAEVNWQPAVDATVENRAMRLSGLAIGLGVEWPGWRGDALRVSVPLSVLAERMQLQRLDVGGQTHALWQGGVRAGLRLGLKLTDGWFLESSLDGRVMPLGRVRVIDGPELSMNQLGARLGLGLLLLPGY